ncbi:MAG: aldo/keto reductase [Methanomicrobiaceae archaeon]|nr:aldo/keto reductase [Methanomicrobiaceae archaeon]
MLYRTVPKTGDRLSILGFGCMRLPKKGGKIDVERATRQVRIAIDRGVNYIDTAVPYHNGESEPFLGQALADGYREKVFLATKLPPWQVHRPEDMDRILDAQLERLRTDHIDYYLVHSLDARSWEKMDGLGVREFLDRAKAEGKIVNAGFSFHGDLAAFREIVGAYPWEFCQIQYNILDEHNQAGTEGLRYASERGLAVIIMEPLRGGRLARRVPTAVQAIYDQAEIERTPAAWALRWVWDHPEVTVVLSGMNEEAHIDENLATADAALPGSLDPEEHALIDRVKETYRALMQVDCTGCNYCMPCPAGVNIPECFSFYNNYHMFENRTETKIMYLGRLGGILGTEAYAGLCRSCGKCEKACPQHLPIRDLIGDVSRTFEGRTMKIKVPLMKVAFSLAQRRLIR